jgi:serine-type D-Ala-D-Ala carboxypeptidase (penicillin-binding protein 5/6)
MMKTLGIILATVIQVLGTWGSPQPKLSPKPTTTAPNAITLDSIPVQTGTQALSLDASSALAVDTATGTILYSHNPNDKRPIASITKLVTCMVILSRHSVNQPVTIGKLPGYQPDDEILGLEQGQVFTVGELVQAALIQSADDSADALAIFDSGTRAAFAGRMNQLMTEWGIPDTHFSSASGLQDQNNYSTASSLIKIGELAMTNPTIRADVDMQTASITDSAGQIYNLTTIDQLLYGGSFYGIKTGYTGGAGESFVGITRVDGHPVITVVLDAGDRFGSTQSLVNWIGRNWAWL